MLTWVDSTLESLLPVLIFHEALALTLGNDEEVVILFTLLNLDFLRLAHDELNLSDHVVFHVRIEREDQILLQLLGEDEPSLFNYHSKNSFIEFSIK